MKKYLAMFLSLALSFSSSIYIFANPLNTQLPIQNISIDKNNSFIQNGITYTINQNPSESLQGFVTISSGKDFKGKTLNIPQKVIYQGKFYTVETIAPYAFYQNNNIENVVIPNTVKNIGSFAFSDCQNLKAIDVITGGNKYKSLNGVLFNVSMDTLIAYPSGKADKQYNLPNNVNKIEQGAFYNNKYLQYFIANSDLQEIGAYAFSNSQSLKEVSGIVKLKTLGDFAFANSSIENIYLSTYLENMGKATFYNSNIKSIEIPYKIKTLPEYTFYNCKNFKNVVFKDGLNVIDNFAFANSSIESFSAPISLNTIGFQSFANCKNLKNIKFNENLQTIKDEAFLNNISLTNFTVTRDLKNIGNNVFYGCNNINKVATDNSRYFEVSDNILYSLNKKELSYVPPKREISYVNISKETETIKNDALNNATSVDTFNVDEKNEKFSSEDGVLYDKDKKNLIKFPPKKNVTNFSIPSTVEKISPYAFKDAKNLYGYISIPANLLNIENNNFENMPNIDGFSIDNNNPNFTAVNDVLYNKDKSILLKYPARKNVGTFDMLKETKTINNLAFEQANIVTLNVGVNVENIEEEAFLNSSIKNINIKEGLVNIKDNAFKGSNIENIILPTTLQNIGDSAFSYCNNLKSIQFNALQTNSFGYNMFIGSNNLKKIIVPVNSYYNYKNYLINSGVDNWQNLLQEYKPPVKENNK